MEAIKRKNFLTTLLGAVGLIGLACIIYSVTNLSVYFVSRAYWAGGNVNIQWGSLLPIIFTFVIFISYPAAGLMQAKLGNYYPLAIGGILWFVAFLLLLLSKNIFITLFALIFAGFGYVMLYSIPLKNATLYYLEKKGTILSVFEACTSLFELCFNLIGEFMVNPDGETLDIDTDKDDEENFYSKDICDNLWKFVVLVGVACGCGMVTAFLTFRPYKKEYDEKLKIKQELISQEVTLNNSDSDFNNSQEKGPSNVLGQKNIKEEETTTAEIEEKTAAPDPITYTTNLKKALLSKRLWLIIFIAFGSKLTHSFNTQTMRTFAAIMQTENKQGRVVQMIPNIKLICYFLSAIAFGQCLDKLGYKVTLLIFTTISLVGGIVLSAAFQVDVIFDILVAITGIINGGGILIFSYHILEVFGTTYFLEVNGINAMVCGFGALIVSLIAFIFSFFIKSDEKHLKGPYRGMYIATTVIMAVAYYLQFYDSSEPFDYSVVITKTDTTAVKSLTDVEKTEDNKEDKGQIN